MSHTTTLAYRLADLGRLRRYTWWFLVPLPAFAAVVSSLIALQADKPVLGQVAMVASFGLAAAATTWSAHIAVANDDLPPLRGTELLAMVGATVALGLALIPASPAGPIGVGWIALPALLLGIAIVRSSRRRRLSLLIMFSFLYTAATAFMVWIGEVSVRMLVLAPVVFFLVAATVWLQWWNFDVARQLELSRRVAADLAVAEERLRFASELHDIQGHHLQVIALKSELAFRLATARPGDAADQMREVQQLARRALNDTRAVVSGYRKVSLTTEISNATRVLAAADIAANAQLPTVDLAWHPEAERLVGLLVREATTNILRHARPTRASFTLDIDRDNAVIRIRNDGAEIDDDEAGTGLAALAERFRAAGGSMRWRHTDGEFDVSAILPYRSHSLNSTKAGEVT